MEDDDHYNDDDDGDDDEDDDDATDHNPGDVESRDPLGQHLPGGDLATPEVEVGPLLHQQPGAVLPGGPGGQEEGGGPAGLVTAVDTAVGGLQQQSVCGGGSQVLGC